MNNRDAGKAGAADELTGDIKSEAGVLDQGSGLSGLDNLPDALVEETSDSSSSQEDTSDELASGTDLQQLRNEDIASPSGRTGELSFRTME